jgi:hypothetical protein
MFRLKSQIKLVLQKMEDGFEDLHFNFNDFSRDDTIDLSDFNKVNILENYNGKDLIHKTGMKTYVDKLLQVVRKVSLPCNKKKVNMFSEYMILYIHGKRNMKKEPVNVSKLNSSEKEVYKRIRKELTNPERRERIFKFINQRDITKRLINYFVVHYILIQNEISYYLDKRTYPYKILGDFNNPHNSDILRLKEKGANIIWINLHQEYKTSKNKKGRRNLHAPYARSISVKGEDACEYSLCELNFYIWLDDMGGFDAFYHVERDVRDKKTQYDEEKRINDNTNENYGKRKKRKIVLKNTDGRNYKTYVVKYEKPAPYSFLNGKQTYSQLLSQLYQM